MFAQIIERSDDHMKLRNNRSEAIIYFRVSASQSDHSAVVLVQPNALKLARM